MQSGLMNGYIKIIFLGGAVLQSENIPVVVVKVLGACEWGDMK